MYSYINNNLSEDRRTGVEVACINSPKNVTISGEEVLINLIYNMLENDQIFARKLNTGVAYHSSHMRAISSHYASLIKGLESSSLIGKGVVMISSVTGERCMSREILSGSDYWINNMVHPVKFSQAVSQLASGMKTSLSRKLGATTQAAICDLIEIGPHSTLKHPVLETLKARASSLQPGLRYHSVLSKFSPSLVSALRLAGHLHSLGYPIALKEVNKIELHTSAKPLALVDLPEYPFNRSRKYWHESRLSKKYKQRKYPRLEFLGTPVADSNHLEMRWRKFFDPGESPWIEDHRVRIFFSCCKPIKHFTECSRLPAPSSTLPPEWPQWLLREQSKRHSQAKKLLGTV